MKKVLCLLLSLGIIASAISALTAIVSAEEQYVNIPDPGLVLALQDTNIDDEEGQGSDGKFTVAQMEELTELEIQAESAVKSLEGLQYCKNLEKFRASLNPIESLEPLKSCTKLDEIVIDNININDYYQDFAYDVLEGYKGTNDLSPLAGLTSLRLLNLNGNKITDISALKNLKNLTYIEMTDNNISDLSPLAGLTKLETLYLNTNQIVDITPLAGLTNLVDLDLWINKIHDISAISSLTNLEFIDIENNYIGDPAPLANLTKLQDGYFDANYFDLDEPSVVQIMNKVVENIEKNSGDEYSNDFTGQNAAMKVAKNLKGESDADGIKLTWTNSAQQGNRKVELTQIFRYDANGKPVMIGTVEGDAASYIDATAEPGESYTYAIRSCAKYEGDYVTSCMSATATATREVAAAVVYGDIDSNGEVTSSDALTVLKASVGIVELTADQEKAADVDGVVGISSSDALSILKYSVGIIDKFPVEG